MKIELKRASEPAAPTDGLRILVDRFWPRGIKKENLACQIWAKNVAPSDELRHFFHDDPEGNWEEFRKRYSKELSGNDNFTALAAQIAAEKPACVTLVYAFRNTEHNNAVVMREALKSAL
jgi:uncharacterized protein YeaO (DUF488 family)